MKKFSFKTYAVTTKQIAGRKCTVLNKTRLPDNGLIHIEIPSQGGK